MKSQPIPPVPEMLFHLTGSVTGDEEFVTKVGLYLLNAIVPSIYKGKLSLIVPPPPREVIPNSGLFIKPELRDKEPVVTSGVRE